jgi:dolichyl-phosphate beta-glucosyltransferase
MEPGSVAIVLPAYNEEARLGPGLDELFAYVSSDAGRAALPPDVRVLVVDDGSTDGTAAIVHNRPEALVPPTATSTRLSVLSLPHRGKGAAVRAGMLAVDADILVFTDADMATPPDQLGPLLAALRDHDIALGSRIQPDGSDMRETQPRLRRMLGRAFHALASAWAAGPVRDTQCGFKGFRREAARDLFARQRINGIAFDVEIIYLARQRGDRIAIVPIRWSDRRGSRLRARPRLALRVAWDLFRIPLIHRRERRAVAGRRA